MTPELSEKVAAVGDAVGKIDWAKLWETFGPIVMGILLRLLKAAPQKPPIAPPTA